MTSRSAKTKKQMIKEIYSLFPKNHKMLMPLTRDRRKKYHGVFYIGQITPLEEVKKDQLGKVLKSLKSKKFAAETIWIKYLKKYSYVVKG